MKKCIYEIKSAKGVHLEQLYQELAMILDSHKIELEPSRIQNIPALKAVFLTTLNHKLVSSLQNDTDFIVIQIK
ncbi:MAG TPA: hypothetical protein VN698_14060 [Bacteroidia bacterium]|nr:hypothetical protein [Bacteroidia bacterium]